MTRPPRRAVLVVAAVAGIVAGAAWTTTLTGAPTSGGAAAPRPPTSTTTAPPTAATTPVTTAPPVAAPPVLLVWTSGGLPAGLADAVRAIAGVTGVTVVEGDEGDLVRSTDVAGRVVDQLEDGWHIPLDVLAVDPGTFPAFLAEGAAAAVAGLRPGEALLGATSAGLRRLGPGATIELTTGPVTVAGIVDDASAAGAELLVAADDAERLGVATERYLLLSYTGDRTAIQGAVAAALHGRAARFRSPAETTWLRHGDAVEPAAVVKAAYGEFAVREGPDRSVEIDPAWVAASIATEEVPILGAVTCNRAILPPLRDALAELDQAGLAHLVDPADFAGCWSARRIAAGQPLSHHAWGVALDLNVDGNPRGSFSTQDARLVDALVRHGFSWGGEWLVPDPAHYELVLP